LSPHGRAWIAALMCLITVWSLLSNPAGSRPGFCVFSGKSHRAVRSDHLHRSPRATSAFWQCEIVAQCRSSIAVAITVPSQVGKASCLYASFVGALDRPHRASEARRRLIPRFIKPPCVRPGPKRRKTRFARPFLWHTTQVKFLFLYFARKSPIVPGRPAP